MAKPWGCLCCGLLNSPNNPKCQACRTHCTVTESAFMCIKCQQMHSDQIFRWTKCNHTYCMKCCTNLINQSLSLKNQMPKCIYTNCNQSLNIENGDLFKDLLLKKYQITQNIKVFDRTEHLISGFIRRIKKNISHEVILSVHDFYDLVYCAKIDCYQCKTLGFELLDCKKCNGFGFTEDCKQCDSTGIHKYNITCKKCKGTGDYIFQAPCNKCKNSGVCSGGRCIICDGTGSFRGHAGRCSGCNGTGTYIAKCRKCDGSGTFRKHYDCRMCSGKKFLPKQTKCSDCHGSGYFKMDCGNCDALGKVRWDCYKCHGYKKLFVLHFNKLCNNQLFCHCCGTFSPNDVVFHWSNCNHTYCYQCCGITGRCLCGSQWSGGILNEINLRRIPVCLVPECNEELTVQNLKLIPISGVASFLKNCILYGMDVLGELIYRKDRFECMFCNAWHLNANKLLWSQCKHAYGMECAKTNVDKYLIREKKLFNSFKKKKQFIPKCCVALCGKKLKLMDAAIIGISKYQRETLTRLWGKQQANVCIIGCYVM